MLHPFSSVIEDTWWVNDDLTLEVIFPNGLTAFGKSMLEKSENLNELVKLVSIQAGKDMRIKFIDAKEYVPKEDNIEEALTKLDVPIEIVED